MFIEKIRHLSDREQKRFYKALCQELLEVFASDYYEHEEDLQQDFHEWKLSDLNDYRAVLDIILEEIAPEGTTLTWRDCKKLNYKRFHLCKVCGEPFIAYDVRNKQRICYNQEYNRFKIGTEEQEGYYFKAAEEGHSLCYMVNKANIFRKYHKRQRSNKAG